MSAVDHTLEVKKWEGSTLNTQDVGSHDDNIVVRNPKLNMTRDEALLHAATIVAIADKSKNFVMFRGILKAVLETKAA